MCAKRVKVREWSQKHAFRTRRSIKKHNARVPPRPKKYDNELIVCCQQIYKKIVLLMLSGAVEQNVCQLFVFRTK